MQIQVEHYWKSHKEKEKLSPQRLENHLSPEKPAEGDS